MSDQYSIVCTSVGWNRKNLRLETCQFYNFSFNKMTIFKYLCTKQGQKYYPIAGK